MHSGLYESSDAECHRNGVVWHNNGHPEARNLPGDASWTKPAFFSTETCFELSVDFSNVHFTSQGMKLIAALNNLRALSVRMCRRVWDSDIVSHTEVALRGMTQLTRLNLCGRGAFIHSDGLRCLRALVMWRREGAPAHVWDAFECPARIHTGPHRINPGMRRYSLHPHMHTMSQHTEPFVVVVGDRANVRIGSYCCGTRVFIQTNERTRLMLFGMGMNVRRLTLDLGCNDLRDLVWHPVDRLTHGFKIHLHHRTSVVSTDTY